MSTWHKVGCCLIAAVAAFGAFADEEPAEPEIREGQLWTYDASTKKLTEIVPEGVTPWVFTLTAEGSLCEKSSGVSKTVDLRESTMPENAPAIVQITDNKPWGRFRTDSVCETLYLPETVTALVGHTFYNWKALKHVSFPTNPPSFSIGADASGGNFYSTAITNAILPLTMTAIGEAAFNSAQSIQYIQLPPHLEAIGASAFFYCRVVKEVRCMGWNDIIMTAGNNAYGGWPEKQTRLVLMEEDPAAAAFVRDVTRVTPFDNLSAADQKLYYSQFGADALKPVGLTVASGLPRSWVVVEPRFIGFRLGLITPQFAGAQPKPEITTPQGDPVSDAFFDFTWTENEQGTHGTVKVVGKPDSPYPGQWDEVTYRVVAFREPTVFTWVKAGDGNWEDASNWSPAGMPIMPGDSAIVPLVTDDTTVTVTVNEPLFIASLSVGRQEGQHLAGDVAVEFRTGLATNVFSGAITVLADGTITHAGPNEKVSERIVLKAASVTVEAGGSISAVGRGYSFVAQSKAYGPGSGRDFNCHAGESSTYQGWGPGNKCYGSIREPEDYGSAAWYMGCPGSGAIRLMVSGSVSVAGSITADALNNYNCCAGSGGSIWITCGTLSGAGKISAGGGITGQGGTFGGSGGRIALYQTAAENWDAFTGSMTTANASLTISTCGTIYQELPSDTAGEGTLVIDNANRSTSYMTPLMPEVVGSFDPFGTVIVRKYGHLRIAAGRTLRVTKGIACESNGTIEAGDGGVIEFVNPSVEATVTGITLATFDTFKCVTPGKTIRFGTAAADKLAVGAGKNLIFRGSEENPVSLLSAVEGTPWQIEMDPNPGVVEVEHVAVQDSNADSGSPMLAISSQNLGNNTNWGFSNPIVPGETITWTGGLSTKWDAVENWDLGRAPVDTDVIAIPSVGTGNYPVLPSGTYLFNRIDVGEGASLTWSGCTVTITNDLTVAGTMAFTAGESLSVEGNVTVTGSVTPATGAIYVTGAGDQTLDFGDTTLFKIQFDKPSGNVRFGAHGFTATQFNCQATTGIVFTFAAGSTYAIPQFLVNGLSGTDRLVTLQSSVPGTKWLLNTTAAGQNVAGVNATDSDATGGDVVYGGTLSRQTDCLGWDTESDVASWLGGSGDFTDPSKWSSGAVPGPDTLVTISAVDGVTLTVTQPAGNPLTVKQLVVYAGTGGKATFEVNSPLTVSTGVEIRSGGNLELNCFNEGGEAPNVVAGDVHIAEGGVLSHTGPNATEVKKLHLKVLGTMTVDEGGAVNVDSKGYTEGKGRGSTRCYPFHGGTASDYANMGTYSGKYCYGCIRKPTEYGAGPSAGEKKYGGGTAILEVPGTLCVNGMICSRSKDVNIAGQSPISSGAGGSIYIRCGTLTGAGSIDARGGYCTGGQGTFGGSGGRVAVYATQAPVKSVFTGKITTANPKNCVACGTVYLQDPDDEDGEGTLIVDNNNVSIGYVTDLNQYVTDACEPFGSVVVTNCGRLKLSGTTRLAVTKGIFLSSNANVLSDAGATIEFVGTNDAMIVNTKRITFPNLVCTNVAKTIRFGTGANDAISIPANAKFLMSGADAEHPVNLWPAAADGKWSVTIQNDTVTDVLYASVSNSTASANITAIDSRDLGGNTMWSFSSVIHPGDVITWTGAVSTEWKEGRNWYPAREPVDTDDIRIGQTFGNYPVLPSGNYSFNKVTVSSEAQLTLDGCNLTVTNALRVAGGLVFAGDETLTLAGSADFTGGTVTRARASVVIAGADNQVCDFGGSRFNKITVARPQGGYVSFGASGFGTATFNCSAAVPVTLVFAAGETYAADGLYLNGVQGESRLVTLESSEPGTAWKLVTGAAQGVAGVTVADCDASAGETVYAGTTSAPSGENNRNWDFERDVASWVGGASGSFTDAANWANGKVPTDTTHVMLHAGDGETVAVAIPSGKPVTVATLRVDAGDGGSAQLTAKSALTVSGDVTLGAGGTLVLDCYDDAGAAPNTFGGDLEVLSGGRITHSGGTATECAKLHLSVAGDVLVAEGGSIDGNSKGYNSDVAHGPGGGNMGTGSSHAGYSANNTAAPYGSILRPVTWGSANCYSIGGGAVHLIVGGTLTVEGEVAADGRRNNTYYTACGGSVWIECGKLCGSGRISAKDGLTDSRTEGFTSSGGRIAVYQRQAMDFDAFPLAQLATTLYGLNAAGTIYLSCDGNKTSDLYIGQPVDFLAAKQKTQFPMPADGDMEKLYKNVNLIIGPHAWVTLPAKASVLVRDVELQDKDSRLYVNGGQLRIRSLRHRDGKRWYKPLADEIADGKVDLGGTVANPGKIEWIGGADGTVLIVR